MTSFVDPVQGLIEKLPGVKQLEELLKLIDDAAKKAIATVEMMSSFDFLSFLDTLLSSFGNIGNYLSSDMGNFWDWIVQNSIGTFYKDYLEVGLILHPDDWDKDAQTGVKTVDHMLGFTFLLQLAVAAFEHVESGLLGSRAGKVLRETIAKVPEEMGLSWAMGMQIDKAFEVATGQAIEEAILEEKRPSRLDWRIIKMLFRQRVIKTKAESDKWLAKLGFPEDLIALIDQLDSTQIPIGDMQRMYEYEILDAKGVHDRLKAQGFSDDDASKIYDLYIGKIETSAGTLYRSTARELFRRQLIDQGHFESILNLTNVPKMEIADDIAAITLEQKTGRIAENVGSLKAHVLRGDMHDETAVKYLQQLGYSNDAAISLVSSWHLPAPAHHMTTAKVLSYFASGVMSDRTQAFNILVANHLRPEDANFLLDHPEAGGAKKHVLSAGLVTQAYLDGVIPESSLAAAYQKAGLKDDTLAYQTGVAKYKYSRRKGVPGANQSLTQGEIREAYKLGIIGYNDAVQSLGALGYGSDMALVLLEITMKGAFNPFAVSPPPAFANVQDAVAFLAGLGFQVSEPPDPRIREAEQMLTAAGWSYIPPSTPPPPPPTHR